MAKRTPRSESDDSTTLSPARPPRPRSRGPREAGDDPAANAPQSPDTYAARSGVDGASDEISPSEEEIRIRAYELYLERGGGHGMHFDDWLRAEEELRKRR